MPNLNSHNPISYFNTEKISFCFSWNTNEWNFVKRDSIRYFNKIFKSLFLCFQETGNGSKDDIYQCKVTLPNYKYFQKRMVPNREVYILGIMSHVKQSFEDNSYTHFVSLTTYNLWNHSKCFIGNANIPTKKHLLQVRYAFSEVFTWLQNHTNHPSIPHGDF